MAILAHVVVGTNVVERARLFYDGVLGALERKRVMYMESASLWGADAPEFMVAKPANGRPTHAVNGSTISVIANSRAAATEFHCLALANGGTDEGAPGSRAIAPTAYAGCVCDLDGNKIYTFCFAPA